MATILDLQSTQSQVCYSPTLVSSLRDLFKCVKQFRRRICFRVFPIGLCFVVAAVLEFNKNMLDMSHPSNIAHDMV